LLPAEKRDVPRQHDGMRFETNVHGE
jgi:hypothetical protein